MTAWAIHPGALALGVVILLWSSVIGDEQPGPQVAPGTPQEPAPAVAKVPPAKDRFPQARFARKDGETIDEEAFIAAFRRQAKAELLPCLRKWRPSPGSLLLSATLEKAGRLTGVTTLGDEFPQCTRATIGGMDFAAITQQLTVNHVTIQWRVDW